MFKIINITLLIISVSLTSKADELVVGNEAPLFALPDMDNEYVVLRDLCGEKLRKPWKNKTKHVVVLSFFATWCKPCIAEIPHLQNIQSKFKDKPVKFYLINVGESEDKIKKFLEGKNISITILIDRYKKISEKYDALRLPRLFIIDQNGYIMLQKRGFNKNGKEFENELENLLVKLLNEQ